MFPPLPVVVNVLETRSPTIVTLPVTVPPTFAFNELFARTYALFAYVPVTFCDAYAELAFKKAAFAYVPVVFCESYDEFAFKKAAFAYVPVVFCEPYAALA